VIARQGEVAVMLLFDRAARQFDGAFALYENGGKSVMDGKHPYWSWTHVHAFDLQTQRMTRLQQVRSIGNGHTSRANDPGIYDRYLTNNALMRLGSA